MGQTGVESFNGRTGAVVLSEDDVNNLKIASAYFAEGNETIDTLNIKELYNNGVRFVFTNWNSATSGYDLGFVLDYFGGSDSVAYYPMASGSGAGSVISVNGKTGVVEIRLSDILGSSGAQVKLCTASEFASTELNTWNSYYEEGYRIVGVLNSEAKAIDDIYLLRQDENNHQPIGLTVGASDAYTPTNPPPYPVTSVNGETGAVTGLYDAENPPPYPVTSVNGEKGAVTGLYDAKNPPPYPVNSVNGSTGAVTVGHMLFGGVRVYPRNEASLPGISFRSESSDFPSHTIRMSILQNGGFPIIDQLYRTESGEKAAHVYTDANPPAFKNEINASTAWLIGKGWGSYVGGVLLHITVVTPDESGWITIPWPSTVVGIHAVLSYFIDSTYPATMYNITINTGVNIRAALAYGSSPWPNRNPIQVNLLMIAS